MIPEKYKVCIDACADCIVACKDAATENLKEDDIEMMSRTIKLDHDCAAVCILAMQLMASNSELMSQICKWILPLITEDWIILDRCKLWQAFLKTKIYQKCFLIS
jgi:hypothetical protein